MPQCHYCSVGGSKLSYPCYLHIVQCWQDGKNPFLRARSCISAWVITARITHRRLLPLTPRQQYKWPLCVCVRDIARAWRNELIDFWRLWLNSFPLLLSKCPAWRGKGGKLNQCSEIWLVSMLTAPRSRWHPTHSPSKQLNMTHYYGLTW